MVLALKFTLDFLPQICLLMVSSSPSCSGTWRFMRRIQTAQRAPLPPRRWSAGDCLRNGSSVTMLSWTERTGHLQKRFFMGHEAKDIPGYPLNCQVFSLCSQRRLIAALYMSCLAYPVVANIIVWDWILFSNFRDWNNSVFKNIFCLNFWICFWFINNNCWMTTGLLFFCCCFCLAFFFLPNIL